MKISFSLKKAPGGKTLPAASGAAAAQPSQGAGAAPAPAAPALAGGKRTLASRFGEADEDVDDVLAGNAAAAKRARLDPAALLAEEAPRLAPAAAVAAVGEEDELDAYMKALGGDVAAVVPPAPLHRPVVVTLEDIMGSAGDVGRAGSTLGASSGAAPSHAAAGAGVAASATSDVDEAQEEEYRRAFLQQLGRKPEPVAAARATSAAAVAPQAASAPAPPPPAVVDVEFTGGEDMADDINYEDLRGSSGGSATAETEGGGAGGNAASTGAAPAALPSSSSSAAYDDAFADEEASLFAGAEWGSDAPPSALEALQAKLARKELRPVDHSKITYPPIRKNLYVEHPSIKVLSAEAVAEVREDLEVKLRGRNVPRPISQWGHAGLPDRLIAALEARGMTEPFAIQKQALPIIMSGRDVIGVAKTGSGKTLAYLLPLMRHVLDQPPLQEGEGPIALVMAPSRELVTQIYTEARKLAKVVGLRVAAVYGGAPVAEQIAELRRGAEVVVCTPGRMIDILTLNAGRLIGMHRVSYCVLDEADRMFDMGFEPQISRLFGVVRPDRQVVLFSATFPTHVEALAKKQLKSPVEVVVGGRSMASSDITQFVEVHEERDKFPRLLQLLGHWYERGSVIVFVDTKEHVDMLTRDLESVGYPSFGLHGGKEQGERDATLLDFKANVRTILVATSVAARGLDVQQCVLVVNYSCPNHLEDYVHRVGRTGRGGRKGTAFTFITPGETIHAQDLIRALKDARQAHAIPPQLVAMAEEHRAKVAAGEAKAKASGFTAGQKGFKFDDSEESAAKAAKDAARRAYEVSAGIRDVGEVAEEVAAAAEAEDEGEGGAAASGGGKRKGEAATGQPASAESGAAAAAPLPPSPPAPTVKHDPTTLALLRAKLTAAQTAARLGRASAADVEAAAAALAEAEAAQKAAAATAAAALIKQFAAPTTDAEATAPAAPAIVVEELEINDYPPPARNKVMRKETQANIAEWTRCVISVRGVYVAPGRKPPPGERKLYICVEGAEAGMARRAKAELRRMLEEETLRLAGAPAEGSGGGGGAGGGGYGKYTV